MTKTPITPAASVAPAAPVETLVSDEFEKGARAGAEAMRFYFLNEDEAAIYDISTTDLESFEASAVEDALRDEQHRINRNGI